MRSARCPRKLRSSGSTSEPIPSSYGLHLVLVSTGLLLALGLVMVLSASMVSSYKDTGSAYSVFANQAVWVAKGQRPNKGCVEDAEDHNGGTDAQSEHRGAKNAQVFVAAQAAQRLAQL